MVSRSTISVLATFKSGYFILPRPIIVNYYSLDHLLSATILFSTTKILTIMVGIISVILDIRSFTYMLHFRCTESGSQRITKVLPLLTRYDT